VHDFRKCDICVVHVVQPKKSAKPKRDEGDSDNEEKKAGVSKPSPKLTKGESHDSIVQPKKSSKPKKDKGDSPDSIVKQKEGEDDEEKKAGVSDPSTKVTQGDSPNSSIYDSPSSSDDIVVGFPPTADEMELVKEDCLQYLHDSGPVDIGLDFTAVDTLILSNLTRSSFQYDDYWKLIHNYKRFYDQWLTLDMVQFYQCWVSRSIGTYP
jgi:hypothetical protein